MRLIGANIISSQNSDSDSSLHCAVQLMLASLFLFRQMWRSFLHLIRLGVVVRFHHLGQLGFLGYAFNLAFPAAANGVTPFSIEQGFYQRATGWTGFARQPEMARPSFRKWFHCSVSFGSLSTTSFGPSASMSLKAQAAAWRWSGVSSTRA